MSDDGYTGDVRPAGPPDTRVAGSLRVQKLSVGSMSNNAYLLHDTATGERLLVDAADEAPRLLALVGDAGLGAVLTTHRHADHWQALVKVTDATGATVMAHRDDADGLPRTVDRVLHHGDEVHVGRTTLEVVHLRGHTPGSVALLHRAPDRPHLFTGDSLFPGGPGNTFGDADAHAQLMDDLEERVFGRLPDETWVYPGHGADTTLGAERPSLREWRERGW